MAERKFTRDDAIEILYERNNWDRWGSDDQMGAMNLITSKERLEAVKLVRFGELVSLSRNFPKDPGPGNPYPGQLYVKTKPRGEGGAATDYLGIAHHGLSCTHIDALCHIWDRGKLWNGKNPSEVIKGTGSQWGDINNWGDGLITRGVLLDIPRFRNVSCVEIDDPVQGWELEKVCDSIGLTVKPGDAIVVHSGRDAWNERHGIPWGSGDLCAVGEFGQQQRPGLHASCLEFIRDSDCSMLIWDMMEMVPDELGLDWSIHAAIPSFGIGLIDNAFTEPLSVACANHNIWEFMVVIAPLRIEGGTGSPVNPLAFF